MDCLDHVFPIEKARGMLLLLNIHNLAFTTSAKVQQEAEVVCPFEKN